MTSGKLTGGSRVRSVSSARCVTVAELQGPCLVPRCRTHEPRINSSSEGKGRDDVGSGNEATAPLSPCHIPLLFLPLDRATHVEVTRRGRDRHDVSSGHQRGRTSNGEKCNPKYPKRSRETFRCDEKIVVVVTQIHSITSSHCWRQIRTKDRAPAAAAAAA
ncbi:hypothetical protein F2P81_004119 [Scophthalmus maximus]|uniref:Uncharacterized protein n=1 Tax=Scophthalmus maximus TaxID=52904 RepID=A0A6A4TL75_SCOMX|nr:hypothetical protein F2P81_004119 [Scophthalmus maximus]